MSKKSVCLTKSIAVLMGLTLWSWFCPAIAATVTVINTNDSGADSLRQAITNAASGDTINFAVPLPPQ